MVMSRPKAENPKNNVFRIRLTDAELAEIEKLAKKLKTSKTAAILKAVKEYRPVFYRS